MKTYRKPADTVLCLWCGEPTEQHPDGRSRLFCSTRCRVRAHRARVKAAPCVKSVGGITCDQPARAHETDPDTGRPIHSGVSADGNRVHWIGSRA